MTLFDDNKRKIVSRFDNAILIKDRILMNNLETILEWALDRALELHEELDPSGHHRLHIAMGDSYGWAIVHDGDLVNHSIRATGVNEGNVSSVLERVAYSAPKSGWVGFIIAGMAVGANTTVYQWEFEEDVLMKLVDETQFELLTELIQMRVF